MLVTDGHEAGSGFGRMMRMRTQAIAENEVYTFVNWLGSYDSQSRISKVADSQLVGRIGNNPVALDFFRNTIALVDNQVVLTPTPCD